MLGSLNHITQSSLFITGRVPATPVKMKLKKRYITMLRTGGGPGVSHIATGIGGAVFKWDGKSYLVTAITYLCERYAWISVDFDPGWGRSISAPIKWEDRLVALTDEPVKRTCKKCSKIASIPEI